MKRRQILMGGLMILAVAMVPGVARASLGMRYPERDVSGKVVEVDKLRGIVVLEYYQGWDREQMKLAGTAGRTMVQRFLERIDGKHAAIFVKLADAENLKKGDRIRIPKYSYAFAGYGNGMGADVAPLYEKLEIQPKRK